MRPHVLPAAIAALCLTIPAASAHITLETQQAAIGSSYKAVFRVPHGCEGSATTGIKVEIPEGVIGVKAMPKPGWTLKTVKGPYARSYDFYHGKIDKGAKEIDWSGGHLLDENYDEFVLVGFLSTALKPGTKLYFPAVQTCEKGVNRWTDIQAEGMNMDGHAHPAPALKLLPKAH